MEILLKHKDLWDVVSPSAPETAPLPEPGRTESRLSERASSITGFCDPRPLQHILYLESAAARWERPREVYGPQRSRLPDMLGEFVSYAPRSQKSRVMSMANDLGLLQQDIEEVCPEEKPADMMKTAMLVRATRAVVRAAGGKGRW
ncbi:hypothetical protein ACLOAV_007987 [Pseudogymnoascus australis]